MIVDNWMFECCWTGKTELAKQVAGYLHKDKKQVNVAVKKYLYIRR